METIQIPCPKCGRELKLRDRSLLGRKGKCPKCGNSFVLEEPDEVELELADAEPTPAGTAARWVPDGGAPAATAPRAPASRPQAVVSAPPSPVIPLIPGLEAIASNDGAAARLKALQKRNTKRRNVGIAVGAGVLMSVCSVSYYAFTHAPAKPGPVQADNPAEALAGVEDPVREDLPAVNNEFAQAGSPTKGKPIELQFVPFGAQVILNIRPAELWKKESAGEELRFCLTPLATLLEAKFQELFKRKPEEIEEAQICLIPGTQGTLPDVAAVIHLVEEAKKSQLLEDFGGERVDDYGHPVYLGPERAFLIYDQKTIAMGPRSQASEMVDAIVGRNPASDGIDELLPLTDRDRHITLVFVPRTLRLHSSWWFPENLKPFMLQVCDWFGDEVESASWSFHLGEKTFYSDLVVRNVTGVTSPSLERELKGKLHQLPHDLLENVRKMNPREAGKRKIIGRLPKMSEVFDMASMTTTGPRHVQVITPLPERAAPNLALGTLLAWDESNRTDFSKAAPSKPATEGPKLPDLIADRLKVKIDVDFRRTPLQEAFAFIAEELKTTIDIDGDALKAGGFTKNMPQTFKLDKGQAKEVIAKILEKYQDSLKPASTMVVVVDEGKKMILVTTLASAEQNNLTPFDVFKK